MVGVPAALFLRRAWAVSISISIARSNSICQPHYLFQAGCTIDLMLDPALRIFRLFLDRIMFVMAVKVNAAPQAGLIGQLIAFDTSHVETRA